MVVETEVAHAARRCEKIVESDNDLVGRIPSSRYFNN